MNFDQFMVMVVLVSVAAFIVWAVVYLLATTEWEDE